MNQPEEHEEWRDVPGYEGYYQVSDKGRVKSVDRRDGLRRRIKGRMLKPREDRNKKYWQVALVRHGKTKEFKVHTLVALAFLGESPEGMFVLHYDDNGKNNNLSNLRYGTQAENTQDALRNCYTSGREAFQATILTSEQCSEIVRRRAVGEKLAPLAEEFCVSVSLISKISLGKRARRRVQNG